jgi:hypothetical protein
MACARWPRWRRYGRRPLQAASPFLLLLYLAWLLAAYLCTAAAGVVAPPPLLDSLGIFVFDTPEGAAGGLALQLLAALCVAGLARARARALRGGRASGGRQGRGWGWHGQSLSARLAAPCCLNRCLNRCSDVHPLPCRRC